MSLSQREKQNMIIWSWYENESENDYPSELVMEALEWFTRDDTLPDYGYTGSWREQLEYCSDRMNGGRARAILRLLKAQAGKE